MARCSTTCCGEREVTKLIALAGQVTEQCILYTALNGYVRRSELRVPRDTIAHIDPDLGHGRVYG